MDFYNNKTIKDIAVKCTKFYKDNKRMPSFFSHDKDEKYLATQWALLISSRADTLSLLYV